jgi:hypothetical protein
MPSVHQMIIVLMLLLSVVSIRVDHVMAASLVEISSPDALSSSDQDAEASTTLSTLTTSITTWTETIPTMTSISDVVSEVEE